MKTVLFAGVATMALTAGSAFAQSTSVAMGPATANTMTQYQAAGSDAGVKSGYMFPNAGSPSGVAPTAVYSPPPQQSAGRFGRTRIYLYPPAEGDDGTTG